METTQTPGTNHPIGDQFPGTYRAGWDDGREIGREEGFSEAYRRALNEWCDVSTLEPYTVVQPYARPAFAPSAPAGSGRHLIVQARASWAIVENAINQRESIR